MSMAPEKLSRGIDAVERNARGQLIANDRGQAMRKHVPWATLLLLIVPLIALALQLVRWAAGMESGWFSWGWMLAATIMVPIAVLLARGFSVSPNVNRKRALIAMDRSLGSADRLVTADEFLKTDNPNGFQQAAIEDAGEWVEQGRISDLSSAAPARLDVKRRAGLVIPAAIVLLLAAFGVSRLQREAAAASPELESVSESQPGVTVEPKPEPQPHNNEQEDEPKPEPKQDKPRGKRPANKSAAPASSTPDEVEESRGKLTEGESSESQQSSSPSSAQGAPSSSGQPSKKGDPTPKKKKKKQKLKPNVKEPKKQEKKEEEPSGATAGQGSSRGSNNNAAASDWSSKSQQSTPDDDESDNDEDAEDDDEEQESRGGVQPNLRDRRTPVNRDLNIGLGSARPNPDANGRGGPGGQKKSRGVASLILGVPIPDRITGQPNKGRTRITQQRITPEAEDAQRVQAEDRGSRNGSVGPVHHPDFSPWLQEYVKRYFLQRRAAADKKKPDDAT